MKETILRLQEEMEQALSGKPCTNGDRCTAARRSPDQAYQLAAQFWQRLKHEVRQSGFPDEAAEVDFFRNIKPKFTSHLEYYLLLMRYQAYAEPGGEILSEFCRGESDRMRRFEEQHAAFIQYYDRGRTEWDDLYFLRRKYQKTQRPPSQVYDRATDFWTNGDWIVTLLLANRRFQQFLQDSREPLP